MREDLVRRALALTVACAATACGTGGVTGTGETTGGGGTDGGKPDGGEVVAPPPQTDIAGCRVDTDTAIDDAVGSAPAIAYGGGRFAVAWVEPARGAVQVAVRDAAGAGAAPRSIPSANATAPALAALRGGGFLLAWEEVAGAGGTVRAQRLDAEGAPAGHAFTVASVGSDDARPDVSPRGDGALIAWTEGGRAAVAAVAGGALTERLTLPGAAQAALTCGGEAQAAVWAAGAQIGFARLPAQLTGDARPLASLPAPGGANLPRAAPAADGGAVVVWEDLHGGAGDEAVYFASIDAGGRASTPVQVSPPGGSADTPDVVMIGSRAVVAYYQFRDGPPAVYLTVVDPDRGPVGEALRVSGHGGARYPRIAWAGGATLGVAYARRDGPVHLAAVTCR